MSLSTSAISGTSTFKVIKIERLTTPEQWVAAAKNSRVGYTDVMANEESLTRRFGEDNFHLILSSCKDLPGF